MSTSNILAQLKSEDGALTLNANAVENERRRLLRLLQSYSLLIPFRPSEEKIKSVAIRIEAELSQVNGDLQSVSNAIEKLSDEFNEALELYGNTQEKPFLNESFLRLMWHDENWTARKNLFIEFCQHPEFNIDEPELQAIIKLVNAEPAPFTLSRTSLQGILARAMLHHPLEWSKEFLKLIQFVAPLDPTQYEESLIYQLKWMSNYAETQIWEDPTQPILTPFVEQRATQKDVEEEPLGLESTCNAK